jgi:RNA polymerase sigma-70 factor (ECF subfamily)
VPETLLSRIAAGDPNAVGDCLERYGGLVWSLVRRFLGQSADAEDAAQEIFVDLWRNAPRFNPALASESTFVTLIARRRLIDRRRRMQRHPEPGPLPESVPERPGGGTALVDVRDEAARAAAALDALREEQRRVLQLAVYHGLTHEEIARVTGLPLGTVKTHARRGLIRVRELLAVEPSAGGPRRPPLRAVTAPPAEENQGGEP